VYRHIFTGPSSALSGHRSATKPCIAHLHGLKEVTGRTIAYAAVQARFALSSVEKWTRKDGNFDLQRFFEMVVRLFESNPEQPWVIDTLRWWNTNVPELQSEPKRKRKRRALSEELGDRSNDAVEEVLQQWKAQETEEMSSPSNTLIPTLNLHATPSITMIVTVMKAADATTGNMQGNEAGTGRMLGPKDTKISFDIKRPSHIATGQNLVIIAAKTMSTITTAIDTRAHDMILDPACIKLRMSITKKQVFTNYLRDLHISCLEIFQQHQPTPCQSLQIQHQDNDRSLLQHNESQADRLSQTTRGVTCGVDAEGESSESSLGEGTKKARVSDSEDQDDQPTDPLPAPGSTLEIRHEAEGHRKEGEGNTFEGESEDTARPPRLFKHRRR
ncbi:hypothetical protein C0992_009749, partial [Termitomyces sp. T32_za158]